MFGVQQWLQGVDPWRLMHDVQGQLQKEFNQFVRMVGPQSEGVTVWTKEDSAVVLVDLPGSSTDKIEVSVEKDVVSVEAEVISDSPPSGRFLIQERSAGKIKRSVKLPFDVDPLQTEAHYDKGVLKLKVHQPESAKPMKIAVQQG